MIDLFSEVKHALDIKYVLEFYGVQFDSKGAALCPLHHEQTPSLKVYADTQSFHCFGCGMGGTVIDFAMKYFRLSSIEAARQLDADFSLNLSSKPNRISQKNIAKIKEDKELLEEFKAWEKRAWRTVRTYYHLLRDWGEMLYVRQMEYFRKYEKDIENICLVETMVDIMIENASNLESQIEFYKNYGKLVQDIEKRRFS